MTLEIGRNRQSNCCDLRLDWLADGVQKILDLARLFPDGVEGARLRLVLAGSSKWVRRPNAVAALSSHLRHCVVGLLQQLTKFRVQVGLSSGRPAEAVDSS